MTSPLRSFTSLYSTTFMMVLAAGLLTTYLGLKLTTMEVPQIWVGGMMSAFCEGLNLARESRHVPARLRDPPRLPVLRPPHDRTGQGDCLARPDDRRRDRAARALCVCRGRRHPPWGAAHEAATRVCWARGRRFPQSRRGAPRSA